MTPTLTSLFFAAGVAGWVYSQMARRTGSANPSSVFIMSGVAGVIAFIFFFTLLKYILHIG